MAPSAMKASWTGCRTSPWASPSMVVIDFWSNSTAFCAAGVDVLAVHQDGTRAAKPLAAAVLSSGQVEVFAEDIQQQPLRVGRHGRFDAVDGKSDGLVHGDLPFQRVIIADGTGMASELRP